MVVVKIIGKAAWITHRVQTPQTLALSFICRFRFFIGHLAPHRFHLRLM
jgi:hypothetical protein